VFDYQDENIETYFGQKDNAGLAGYIKDGKLPTDCIYHVSEILRVYRILAMKFVPENEVYVFTTAAFRNIINKNEAFKIIKSEKGLNPIQLSGLEEARLDFVGVTHATKATDGFLIDVGGASTELVSFSNGAMQEAISLPIGALDLYTKHAKNLTITKSVKKSISDVIQKRFSNFNWHGKETSTLIGVGGTARTALKLSKLDRKSVV
jgi:exopolyphosphatase/guanosine-5'-triphosphate,3'-diphosphate pyrophosphatase